ncbi:uncharacterized protein LOC129237864 [Anastrepha obliqua]|uniref:uncharacterized protein LOC129237864 n=1 Tax=Anastrepha obliqua TaxID=95512 RepID=UPI00240A6815|nr:uncharacterized protein LOC129237864 [Anastrepha obliqua]
MCWSFKALLWLTALLCLGGGRVAAWQARGNYHSDAHPGKCTITETVILSPGETVKSPDDCAEIRCENENGDAQTSGCSAIGTPDGCMWGDAVNQHAPFPECCARHLICDGGLNNETLLYQQNVWEMFLPNLKAAAAQGALEMKQQ